MKTKILCGIVALLVTLATPAFSFSVGDLDATALGKSEDGKKVELTFAVSGVCGMCEDRIEGALDVKGVILADWDMASQELTVVFMPNVIPEAKIHELLNQAGHDTAKSKATDEQYEGLHGCCKYREGGAGSECSSKKN